MSAGAGGAAPSGDPPIGRGLARALGFGLVAALFGAAALTFGGVAAYLSLLPVLEPRLAALAVAGASLALALATGWIAHALVNRSAQRATARVRSSLLIALAPPALRLAARHARLVGLVSALGALVLAARNSREK